MKPSTRFIRHSTSPAFRRSLLNRCLFATIALSAPAAHAALSVTPSSNAALLTSNLLGTGITVVGSPSLFGAEGSAGFFTGGLSAGFSFDSGILFSSGNVSDVIGPNNDSGTSTNFSYPGDADLTALVGTTHDAAGLIFNFSTASGNLFFNFIFGSEEYLEYVGSFNDGFAFFLILDADPETPGHQPGTVLNLALVPGTTDVVSVNNVNTTTNSAYFVNNTSGTENHELDGRTTTLTAVAENIGPGEHQLKIAIADASDGSLDSVVFLQAGTFGGSITPVVVGLDAAVFLAAGRQIESLAVSGGFQDLNSRLFRQRTGFRDGGASPAPAPAASSKDAKASIPPAYTSVTRPWEVFASFSYQNADFDSSSLGGGLALPGYEVDLYHATVGVEFDINANFSVGLAFIGTEGDADFTNGGDIDIQRYGGAVYGSFYKDDIIPGLALSHAVYADLLYGYSESDYDVTRRAGANRFSGSTDGGTHLIELNSGITFSHGSLKHGPYVGLAWQNGKIDAFTDNGGLSYEDIDVDSLVSTLGYQVSHTFQTGLGAVVPQFRVAWEHEFEDQSFNFLGNSIGERDDDAAVVGLGVLWRFHERAYAVFDSQARFSGDVDTYQVGIRATYQF